MNLKLSRLPPKKGAVFHSIRTAGATVLANTMQADPAQKISVVFTSQNADFVPGGHALIFRVSFLSSPSDSSPSDH
jgi:hypothetical protein